MSNKSDPLISSRERLLNRVLRVDPDAILNPGPAPSGNKKVGLDLAGELKQLLNKIKSLAMTADGSLVNYQQIADHPLYQSYREQAKRLANFNYAKLGGSDQFLAFWLNLYNSLVIDGVIQEKVQESVTESWIGIMGFFQKTAYTVFGQRFSLTDIEHGILRGNRGFPYFPGLHFASSDPRIESIIPVFDPRIHFALNCASNSCPPIGVYDSEHIQEQLDLAARNFINNDLRIDPDNNLLSVSKIFKWYLGDFGGEKALPGFLEKYLKDGEAKRWINQNQTDLKIRFHPYDWGLNKAGH